MRKLFLKGIILIIIIFGAVFLQVPNSVTAQSQNSQNNQETYTISLDQIKTIEMGDSFIVSGTIKDQNNEPLENKSIFFSIDGEYLGQTPSDKFGRFSREFSQTLDAGTYKITAVNNRENLFINTASFIYLSVLPTEVVVQVTPAIPDVVFFMDGRRFFTDDQGFATLTMAKSGVYSLSLLNDEYENPNQKIELGRWTDEIYKPSQDVTVPSNKVIQVGLNVFQKFSMDFVDLNGKHVDPSRISEFMIRSLQGDVFILQDGSPTWLPASRTARRINGLEETKLYYSVINVMVDGSNVVNQSQQRFYTSAGGNLTIELILYSLSVEAKDGLFGWHVGDSLKLEYPDGNIEEFHLDDNGSVSIDSLARGTYFLNMTGAKGLDNTIPVALSRDQTVTIKILTYFDIAFVGLIGFLFVLGLLIYGRPWILKSSIKTIKSTYKKVIPQSAEIINLGHEKDLQISFENHDLDLDQGIITQSEIVKPSTEDHLSTLSENINLEIETDSSLSSELINTTFERDLTVKTTATKPRKKRTVKKETKSSDPLSVSIENDNPPTVQDLPVEQKVTRTRKPRTVKEEAGSSDHISDGKPIVLEKKTTRKVKSTNG